MCDPGPREPYLVPLLGWDSAFHNASLSSDEKVLVHTFA